MGILQSNDARDDALSFDSILQRLLALPEADKRNLIDCLQQIAESSKAESSKEEKNA